jgi:hypothetical protein
VEEAVVHGSRYTILLLVLLGGLGGYIYFVDSKRDPAAEGANARAFAELVADDIEEIEIKNASGETSHVQRVGTDWQLIAPDKADADDGVVGTGGGDGGSRSRGAKRCTSGCRCGSGCKCRRSHTGRCRAN